MGKPECAIVGANSQLGVRMVMHAALHCVRTVLENGRGFAAQKRGHYREDPHSKLYFFGYFLKRFAAVDMLWLRDDGWGKKNDRELLVKKIEK